MSAADSPAVRSFHVWPKSRPDFGADVHARTAGQAKAKYFTDLRESWPGVPYTDLRVHVVPTVETEAFANLREYRRVPWLKLGMRVVVAGRPGRVVGHDSSANLRVLLDGSDAVWSAHPHSEVTYLADDGSVIAAYSIDGKRTDQQGGGADGQG